MNDDQIKHMVNRFMSWHLPENFNPDCGIHFDADAAKKINPRNQRYEPNGTNLFDATQAEAMVRHMLEGLPVHTILPRESGFSGAEVGAEPLPSDDIFNPFGKAGGWQAFIKRGSLGAPDFYYGWGQGLTEAEAVAAAAANYKLDLGRAVPPHGSGP